MSKYQLSRVNSYFSIEKNAIPDLSQKVPKNEEFWMNANISMQQIKEKKNLHSSKTPRFKALFEIGRVLHFSRLRNNY